ncbi:PilN domain-containing protein [Acetobacter sp. DsW_063]|uniref:PilN domain-containing protein n=1 Tax=Acetobacter sp. DsW_063 TaxID=1514894 RepID=UPI000A384863|nr:PilN domain-containing protein [Acetobacter sp. DsW_063]OUJ16839.1 hypothetical protein HK28_09945 [Acetobacter sp. DsW_063]
MMSSASSIGKSGLKGFVEWWGGQLRECLPPPWRGGGQKGVIVSIGRNGRLEESVLDEIVASAAPKAGKFVGRWRRGEVRLALPEGGALSRLVLVPAAAVSDAVGLLTYEFDRLTPFNAAETAWVARPKEVVASGVGTMFSIVYAPNFVFENALSQLRERGLIPVGLVGRDERDEPVEIPLERPAARPRLALRIGVPVLCGALLAAPFAMQAVAMARVDGAIAALAPERARAEALRREISGYTAGQSAVTHERKSVGDIMGVLKALTETLPDDTFLTALTVRDRHVTAQGQTREAPQLIGLLEHRAGFADAAFSGPVTHSGDTNTDAFTITATAPN